MSRIKRVVSWCAVLSTFAVFSVLLLWGMAGVGSAASISQAVNQIARSGQVDPSKGAFVAMRADGNLADRLFGKKAVRVCFVTNAQLQVIQSRWQTTVTEVGAYSLATVYAPRVTPAEMQAYVSGSPQCVLVHMNPFFFLPVEGGVS